MDGSFTTHERDTRGIEKGDWIVFRLTSDNLGHSTGGVMSVRPDIKDGDSILSLHLPFVRDKGDAIDFVHAYFQIIGKNAVLARIGHWESAAFDVVFHVEDFHQ